MSRRVNTHTRRDGTVVTWSGRGGAVCTLCDLVFSGVVAFDRHIKHPVPGQAGVHLHPSEVGLELDPHGKWRLPQSPLMRARQKAHEAQEAEAPASVRSL